MRKFIILLLILLSSYYVFGQNCHENYEKANSYYENKDYHNAIIYYEKYLELCSDHNHMIMMMIAMSYEKLEDYKSAIEKLNKVIQIKRNYPDAYFLRGINKFKLGDNHGACEDMYLAVEFGNKLAEEYLSIVCPNEELLYRELPNCNNINDLNKWIEFVETYPNSNHIDESFNSLFEMYYYNIYKTKIDSWTKIDDYNNQIFINYAKFFPNGIHINQMNGNNVKKNLVRKELPVCTKVEHLKQWEKFMKEHPNSDYLNMTIFDLYYYQVMYDYLVTTALETVDDGQELIKLNKKYLELFPNGIYVENVSNVISTVEKSVEEYKKYLEEFALEQARKRAREIARQREYERQREYNNSSSNSSNTNNEISITKDNVMRYVDKIETQTEHSYNTIYRVYYSNGEEALIKYESGKWYYDCGALTGWSKASSKASAIYYAYKWRDSW